MRDHSEWYTTIKKAILKELVDKKKTLWPLFMDGVQLPQG